MARRFKLLIAFDGSKTSDAALYDLRLAGLPDKLEAKVLTVIDLWLPPVEIASGMVEGWYAPAIKAAGQQAKASKKEATLLAARAEKYLKSEFPSWKITTQSIVEHPAQGILRVAESFRPNLIAMGTHGHGALGRLVLGSVSLKVLHHAHTSVRISRQGKNRGSLATPPLILIALDGSPDSRAAVEEVAARNWPKGSEFKILTVVDDRMRLAGASLVRKGKPATLKPEGWLLSLVESAEMVLARAGLKVDVIVTEGEPRGTILNVVKKIKPTSLILGSRGMSGLQRFLLGSVSTDAAAHANCTVEIVRAKH